MGHIFYSRNYRFHLPQVWYHPCSLCWNQSRPRMFELLCTLPFHLKKYLVQKCKLDVINILHFRKAYKIDIEKETKIGTKKKLVNVKLILSSRILACINSLLFVYRHHLVTNKVKTVIVSPPLSPIQRQNCSWSIPTNTKINENNHDHEYCF